MTFILVLTNKKDAHRRHPACFIIRRDNMTTLELVLNMLAEATTTEISKQKAPATLSENIDVARAGGKVAGDARKAIETQTGVPVITSKNAAQLNEVVTNLLEDTADMDK